MLTWDYIDMWMGLTVSHRLANAYASLCRASFGKSQCSLDAMLGALNFDIGLISGVAERSTAPLGVANAAKASADRDPVYH
jgi:hypothetical protein